jgi:hypothetical protein
MQAPVEIRYAGVVVASAQDVRELDGGALFLPVRDPLPVGTLVLLRSGSDDLAFRVCHVIESPDPAVSGIQVQPARADEDAMWIPSEMPKAHALRVASMPALVASEPASGASTEAAPAVGAEVAAPESAPETVEAAAPVSAEPALRPETPQAEAPQAEAPQAEAPQAETIASVASAASVAEPSPDLVTASEAATSPAESAVDPEPEVAAAESEAATPTESAPSPPTDELPPARPTQGGGGRRRTKRRR